MDANKLLGGLCTGRDTAQQLGRHVHIWVREKEAHSNQDKVKERRGLHQRHLLPLNQQSSPMHFSLHEPL